MSRDSLKDVCWCSSNVQTATRKILQSSPDVVVYTDASQTGWGAHFDHGNNTCGVWSKSESLRHIHYFYLFAVKLALASLFDNRSNIHLRVMSDNTTTVSYISSMGGCKSTECNSIPAPIVQDLAMYIASFNFTFFFLITELGFSSGRFYIMSYSKFILVIIVILSSNRICKYSRVLAMSPWLGRLETTPYVDDSK